MPNGNWKQWFRAKRWGIWLMGMLLVLGAVGCSPSTGTSGQPTRLRVATTTGMIADIARHVGGDDVEVISLMGPGVDPHLYKASEGDIGKLSRADLILYNGLHLEGRMGEILEKLSAKRPTVAVAAAIPQEQLLDDGSGNADPHIWFDVTLWIEATKVVRDSLVQVDPAHKAAYQKNADAYLNELEELHRYAKDQLALIPQEQRVLVTAHDAFGYLGRAYDVEVVGLQGISTDAQYGLGDVQALIDLLVQRKIKAVFLESSIPPRSIEAVVQGAKARGHDVKIGGELFSDAMGAANTPEGTYMGMVRHNVDIIVQALQ